MGSELVSTSPITGMPRRLASDTAISSFFVSTTKTAAGKSFTSSIPSKFRFMRLIWRRIAASSLPGSFSSSPSWSILRNLRYFASELLMVVKLVSPPPIQRFTQKGIWQEVAASRMISWACFLVPIKSMSLPEETTSSILEYALSRSLWVFSKSIMEIPLRLS